MRLSPVDTNNLGVFESGGRKGAVWYPDETQVTVLKYTIDKPAFVENSLDKVTTDKLAVVEFT